MLDRIRKAFEEHPNCTILPPGPPWEERHPILAEMSRGVRLDHVEDIQDATEEERGFLTTVLLMWSLHYTLVEPSRRAAMLALSGAEQVAGRYEYRIPTDEEMQRMLDLSVNADFYGSREAARDLIWGWCRSNKVSPVGFRRSRDREGVYSLAVTADTREVTAPLSFL